MPIGVLIAATSQDEIAFARPYALTTLIAVLTGIATLLLSSLLSVYIAIPVFLLLYFFRKHLVLLAAVLLPLSVLQFTAEMLALQLLGILAYGILVFHPPQSWIAAIKRSIAVSIFPLLLALVLFLF